MSIIEFFRPPEQVNLAQLTSATLTKLEEFRDKTSTGKYQNYSVNDDLYPTQYFQSD